MSRSGFIVSTKGLLNEFVSGNLCLVLYFGLLLGESFVDASHLLLHVLFEFAGFANSEGIDIKL